MGAVKRSEQVMLLFHTRINVFRAQVGQAEQPRGNRHLLCGAVLVVVQMQHNGTDSNEDWHEVCE